MQLGDLLRCDFKSGRLYSSTRRGPKSGETGAETEVKSQLGRLKKYLTGKMRQIREIKLWEWVSR